MAVDCASGGVLGYARWVLPVSLRKQGKWPVGRVLDVSDEEVQLRELFDAADWTFATGGVGNLDDRVHEIDYGWLTADKDYLCRISRPSVAARIRR